MAKYDLGKSSDVNRFMKDIENDILASATDDLMHDEYDVECPHCGAKIRLSPGKHPCPECSEEIDLKLDIDFKT